MKNAAKKILWKGKLTFKVIYLNEMKRCEADIGGRNKAFLFDWSFLVVKQITLQFTYCN